MVIVAIFFECFVRAINCIFLLFYYFLNFFRYIFLYVYLIRCCYLFLSLYMYIKKIHLSDYFLFILHCNIVFRENYSKVNYYHETKVYIFLSVYKYGTRTFLYYCIASRYIQFNANRRIRHVSLSWSSWIRDSFHLTVDHPKWCQLPLSSMDNYSLACLVITFTFFFFYGRRCKRTIFFFDFLFLSWRLFDDVSATVLWCRSGIVRTVSVTRRLKIKFLF